MVNRPKILTHQKSAFPEDPSFFGEGMVDPPALHINRVGLVPKWNMVPSPKGSVYMGRPEGPCLSRGIGKKYFGERLRSSGPHYRRVRQRIRWCSRIPTHCG